MGWASRFVRCTSLAVAIVGCGAARHAYRWDLAQPCIRRSEAACAVLPIDHGTAPIAMPGTISDVPIEASSLGDVGAEAAAVVATSDGQLDPIGTLGERFDAPLFHRSATWTTVLHDGAQQLVAHHRQGSLAFTVLAGCRLDGVDGCSPGDVAWAEHLAYFWRPDLESFGRAVTTVAYDPELGRVGAGGRLSPMLRRLADGGFAIGLSISYADFGLRQRFGALAIVEYDFSHLVRTDLGGANRTWNLALGLETGLAIVAVPSDFDQALLLGLGIDPYLELRLYLSPNVIVPVRFEADVSIARTSSWYPAASTGLGVVW